MLPQQVNEMSRRARVGFSAHVFRGFTHFEMCCLNKHISFVIDSVSQLITVK